jgi:hypothetical protein
MLILFKKYKSIILARVCVLIIFVLAIFSFARFIIRILEGILGTNWYVFGIDFSILFNTAFGLIGVSMILWLLELFDKYILYIFKCAIIVRMVDDDKSFTSNIEKVFSGIGGMSAIFILEGVVAKCSRELSKKIGKFKEFKNISNIPFISVVTRMIVSYVDECVFCYLYITRCALIKGIVLGMFEYVRQLKDIIVDTFKIVLWKFFIKLLIDIVCVCLVLFRLANIWDFIILFVIHRLLWFFVESLFLDMYVCVRICTIFSSSFIKKSNTAFEKNVLRTYETDGEVESENTEVKKARKDYSEFADGKFELDADGKICINVNGSRHNIEDIGAFRTLLKAVPFLKGVIEKCI